MLTPQEFVARWDGEPLIRASAASLSGANLPASSKIFLMEAGLPRVILNEYNLFESDNGLSFIQERQETAVRSDQAGDSYKTIGKNTIGAFLCLQEPTGKVVISTGSDKPPRFVNSSIPQFAEALLTYQEFRVIFAELLRQEQMRTVTYEEVDDLISELQEHMRRIDKPSMKRGAYWYRHIDRILG